MIECFVIDDEFPAVEVLENYINQSSLLHLSGSSTHPVKGLEMIEKIKPQVVFLDIEMPELNGLALKELYDKDILTVFCTAYSEYAIKSYELQAADYLVKPITHNRFLKTVHRLVELVDTRKKLRHAVSTENYITIKSEHKGKIIKIDIDEIEYVEASRNYIIFHRGKQKTLSYNSMRDVEERLPKDLFIRIHKSFIVSLRQISYIEYHEVALKNYSIKLPIGSSYKEGVLERFKNKLL